MVGKSENKVIPLWCKDIAPLFLCVRLREIMEGSCQEKRPSQTAVSGM
jgi:hypothetical protein